jgi:hypothetical protein
MSWAGRISICKVGESLLEPPFGTRFCGVSLGFKDFAPVRWTLRPPGFGAQIFKGDWRWIGTHAFGVERRNDELQCTRSSTSKPWPGPLKPIIHGGVGGRAQGRQGQGKAGQGKGNPDCLKRRKVLTPLGVTKASARRQPTSGCAGNPLGPLRSVVATF